MVGVRIDSAARQAIGTIGLGLLLSFLGPSAASGNDRASPDSRSSGVFRRIAPSPPAFIESPFRACVVATTPEALWQHIAAYYRHEGWEWKQMQAEYVERVRREWVASLDIDFSTEMVIGVFYASQDLRPDVKITIDAVQEEAGELRIESSRADTPPAANAGPYRYPYPYYDLIACRRSDAPVAFYENGVRVGLSLQSNVTAVRDYLRGRGLDDVIPTFAPHSRGAVALAYPQRQIFPIERSLPGRHEKRLLSVDEVGRVKELEEPSDYADGLIEGEPPEDRHEIVAMAIMILRGVRFGATSPEGLRQSVRCRTGADGIVICVDRETDGRFEVVFDRAGNLVRFVDRLPNPPKVAAQPAAPVVSKPSPPPPPQFDLNALLNDLESPNYAVRELALEKLGRSHDPRALEPLVASLRREPYGQGATVAALVVFGPAAAAPLLAAFTGEEDRDNAVFRQKIAEVLGQLKASHAVGPLTEALKDRDVENLNVRMQAAIALGKIQDRSAVEPLIDCLKTDAHYMVREYAAEALGSLNAASALPPLMEALKDPGVRAYAAKALRQIDAAGALARLRAAMEEDPVKNSPWVMPAMDEFGEASADPLIAWLKAEDVEVRRRALGALRNVLLRSSDKRAQIVDAILLLFESGGADFMTPDEQVAALEITEDPRGIALMIQTLARTDGVPPHELYSAVHRRYSGPLMHEAFLAALQSEDPNIRLGAAAIVGELRLERAIGPLIGFLKDADPRMRRNAARSLGSIKTPVAVTPLIVLAKSKQEPQEVRIEAIMALKRIGGPQAEATFAQIKADRAESQDIRTILMTPAEVVKANKALQEGLARGMASAGPQERMGSAAALAAIGDSNARKTLLEGLLDKDPNVRAMAVEGLSRKPDGRLVGPLLALLKIEPDASVRKAAMRILAGLQGAVKTASLIELLGTPGSAPDTRIFAMAMLGERRSPEAEEPLVGVLRVPNASEEMVEASLKALVRIKQLSLPDLLLHLLERNDAALNRFVAEGLRQLAGEELGADPQAMRKWILEHRGKLSDS
jgi:HEAT repeat protein